MRDRDEEVLLPVPQRDRHIDAPEVEARCPQEATGAERATLALRAWLNQAPFQMVAKKYDANDRYGRELRIVTRAVPGGTVRRLSEDMVEGGYARRYVGGWRGGWC